MALAALQVRRHQTQLVAFEFHLKKKEKKLIYRFPAVVNVSAAVGMFGNFCADLSHEQVPHHLSGGIGDDLALQEFDSRLLQHHTGKVALLAGC